MMCRNCSPHTLLWEYKMMQPDWKRFWQFPETLNMSSLVVQRVRDLAFSLSHCCGMGLIPGPGTPTCHGHGQKKKKLDIELPHYPATPLLEIIQEKWRPRSNKNFCSQVFKAALFIIAGNRNNPNVHSLINEYIKCVIFIQWNIIHQEKNNELLIHARTQINLKNIFSERSQRQKTTYIYLFIWNIQNRQISIASRLVVV